MPEALGRQAKWSWYLAYGLSWALLRYLILDMNYKLLPWYFSRYNNLRFMIYKSDVFSIPSG
jgi:hypothetical protein